MGYLDHQLQSVGRRQPIGEMLGPVGLEALAYLLDGAEQPSSWAAGGAGSMVCTRSRSATRMRPTSRRESAFRGTGPRSAPAPPRRLPDGRARARARWTATSSGPAACSTTVLPLGPAPLRHRLAQGVPERRRELAARRTFRIPHAHGGVGRPRARRRSPLVGREAPSPASLVNPRAVVPMEVVLVHQPVQGSPVDAREARGLGHVAARPADQAS